MSQDKELKDLARRVYISYHQDGLLDILLGTGIIGFGLMLLTGSVVFNVLAWMPVLFYVPLKNRITVRRFGYVQFSADRKRKSYLWIVFVVGLVAFALFFGLFIFTTSGNLPTWLENMLRRYDLLLLGFFLSIPMVIGAVVTGLNRLYVYAVLTLGVIGTGILLGIDAPYFFLFLGLVILIVGLSLLVRFLHQYPLHEDQ